MELDDMGGGAPATAVARDPSQWCGRHAPAQPGLCWRHNVRFHELHDDEIRNTFGIDAVFYCPAFGCDEIDWDNTKNHPAAAGDILKYRRWLITFNGSQITPELERVVGEIFRSAARLKVFFLKQRQLVERLKRAGVFEG